MACGRHISGSVYLFERERLFRTLIAANHGAEKSIMIAGPLALRSGVLEDAGLDGALDATVILDGIDNDEFREFIRDAMGYNGAWPWPTNAYGTYLEDTGLFSGWESRISADQCGGYPIRVISDEDAIAQCMTFNLDGNDRNALLSGLAKLEGSGFDFDLLRRIVLDEKPLRSDPEESMNRAAALIAEIDGMDRAAMHSNPSMLLP